MATWFAPAVYDPSSQVNVSTGATHMRFEVYTDSILGRHLLLKKWYQYLLLVVGAAFFAFPMFYWAVVLLQKKRKKRRRSNVQSDPDGSISGPFEGTVSELPSPVRKFGFYIAGQNPQTWSQDMDLCIVPLKYSFQCVPNMWRRASSAGTAHDYKPEQVAEPKLVYAIIEEEDLSQLDTQAGEAHFAEATKALLASRGLSGIAITSNLMALKELQQLLSKIAAVGVSVLFIEESQDLVLSIHPSFVSGVIFRNACIMRDGSRRDFFQAADLRKSLARCASERQNRPTFFTGFLDLWSEKPKSAVIRRSNKIARFNDAILYSGPESESLRHAAGHTNQESSSAFDWLKREEIIQVRISNLFQAMY
jgi:hypothetical protein